MRTTIGKSRIIAAAAVSLAALAIGLAGPATVPATAAPSGPSNAQQTIKELQSQGYTVIINRLGATPLDRAAVVAVRPGPHYSRTEAFIAGVTQRTVYVDVK